MLSRLMHFSEMSVELLSFYKRQLGIVALIFSAPALFYGYADEVAAVWFVTACIPYIWAIFKRYEDERKRAKPIIATWLVWMILDWIAALNMSSLRKVDLTTADTSTIWSTLQNSELNGQIVSAVFCATTIAIIALWKGKRGWSKTEIACFIGGLIGAGLYAMDSEWSLVIALISLFVVSVPTFQSAWKDPSNEDKTAWFMYWIVCLFTFMAVYQNILKKAEQTLSFSEVIDSLSLVNSGQAVMFFIIESIMVAILLIRPRMLKTNS